MSFLLRTLRKDDIMADIKKEQEREDLPRAIWNIANDLRGSVDGWDFKNYVLGTMFYRYISENFTAYVNQKMDAANADEPDFEPFDYTVLSDEDAETARTILVSEKGFFMLPSELFCNVRANAASDPNLNMTLEKVFRNIESSAIDNRSEKNFYFILC